MSAPGLRRKMGGGGRRSLHVVTAQPCLAGKRGDLPARQAFRDRQRHFLAEAGLHQGRQRSAIAHVALEGVDPGAVLAGVAVERSAQAKEEARGDNAIARQQRGDLAAIGPLRDAHGDGAGTSSVKRLVERDNEPSGEDENTEHDKRDQPADQDPPALPGGARRTWTAATLAPTDHRVDDAASLDRLELVRPRVGPIDVLRPVAACGRVRRPGRGGTGAPAAPAQERAHGSPAALNTATPWWEWSRAGSGSRRRRRGLPAESRSQSSARRPGILP